MSARPRDLLKTRPQRIGEVFTQVHLKNGNADSNLVAFGGDLAPATATDDLAIGAFTAVLGQKIVDKAAQTVVTSTTISTGAGQFRKVLIEADADGVATLRAGDIASSQLAAQRPAEDPTKIILGVIEVPASHTGGTTALTQPMLIKEPYWAA